MEYMDEYSLRPELIDKLKVKIREQLGKATAKEQKDGNSLRNHLEYLKNRQTTLIKKNLDGFISDKILKTQLDIIENEIDSTELNLSSIIEMEIDIEEVFEFTRNYLEKPSSVWVNAKLDKRLKLQWFQFPQGIILKNYNYEIAQIANVFKAKEVFLPPQLTRVDFSTVFVNQILVELEYLASILKD